MSHLLVMIELVKLSEWARANGVSRQSATRWFHAGVLPVPARQLASGTILVDEATAPAAGVAIYARLSSGDQRGDLPLAACEPRRVPGDYRPTSRVAARTSGRRRRPFIPIGHTVGCAVACQRRTPLGTAGGTFTREIGRDRRWRGAMQEAQSSRPVDPWRSMSRAQAPDSPNRPSTVPQSHGLVPTHTASSRSRHACSDAQFARWPRHDPTALLASSDGRR